MLVTNTADVRRCSHFNKIKPFRMCNEVSYTNDWSQKPHHIDRAR
ncbi:hypothetical protein BVRB_5g125480 [Beta vulgaris subsp. vulgaris]|uniref:Uncharacterized protein n=1 Tax=Beta vulgaris subsp. vulgaris TaxID=3555 RepID=A0A0J8BCA0_BETVV|nr:hypothetical protein BVRB_5g125480 [Beta vulgaris subsp. vulgaris]